MLKECHWPWPQVSSKNPDFTRQSWKIPSIPEGSWLRIPKIILVWKKNPCGEETGPRIVFWVVERDLVFERSKGSPEWIRSFKDPAGSSKKKITGFRLFQLGSRLEILKGGSIRHIRRIRYLQHVASIGNVRSIRILNRSHYGDVGRRCRRSVLNADVRFALRRVAGVQVTRRPRIRLATQPPRYAVGVQLLQRR